MIPKRDKDARADPLVLSEEALVAAARRHDEAAVRELIRRFNPRLFRVARGIVESDVEAEDVVQEAYVAAFTRLHQFRGASRFSTWITRITINAARMRKRGAPQLQEYDTVSEPNEPDGVVVSFRGSGIEQPETALGRSQIAAMLET